ncbi:MAG: sulfite exporter TauE/SafE family protein [Cypionkella sp.]|nr:sulfite exporter TauE/SafE family protein [Cypionkella sp.]
MGAIFDTIGTQPLLLALGVTLFAGFVKGAIGFAMPLIMIGAFSSFLPAEVALAGLIMPTLVTNIAQAFRQGVAPAMATARKYWRILAATVIFIPISAQFFWAIPQGVFLALLGLPITAFALAQLLGLPLAIKLAHQTRAQWGLGTIGGLYGGVSGIWGPPLLVYLLSVRAEKVESVRVQGVVFLIGAAVLLAAHLQSGLMSAPNLAFSALLIVPAIVGQTISFAVQDRLDQSRFRRATQVLLVATGLNLIRQALAHI